MKKKLFIILPVLLVVISLVTVSSIAGCRPAPPAEEVPIVEEPIIEEPAVIEEPIIVEEPVIEEPAVEEPQEEPVSEEELKDALFEKLNNFFEAVKEDKEYAFFSSYTIDVVGTEEEYKKGTKTDIFFIIKEAHSNWQNLEAKEIVVDGDWATLTITGDRMAEGVEYTGEEISFKFVNEDNEWKIDFSGR
jgi:hypothetical protein